MDDLTLAADFPAATREEWLALVSGVLKGADFDRKLVATSYDGIRIEPLYPKAEPQGIVTRAAHAPWRVSQRVDHPDADKAAELARTDLEGGADSLTLVFAGAPSARSFGITAESSDDLDRTLDGTMLDLIHVRVDAGARAFAAADLLASLAEKRGHAASGLDVDFGIDPIGTFAVTGRSEENLDAMTPRCSEAYARLSRIGFGGRIFLADGRPYHEAGASEAQELACVLATGLAYLRALESTGHPIAEVRSAIGFLLVADADEILTVAKFRALRRLWARVEEACGLQPQPIRLHAETAWRMTTRRDPQVNMLRTTLAAFSAGIGGADSVTALPFTAAIGLPDSFARRVSRNMQLILLQESNLWRVADPAAGSGGFEALTDALCDKAWAAFQEIERESGIVASLSEGLIQARIATIQANRDAALATRREPLTGTSEFPNIREAPAPVLMPMRDPPRQGDGALPSLRLAEPYERLRDRSDAMLAAKRHRPKVFLANLGPIAAFSARATFAANAFEAGGIEAVSNDGFTDPADLAAAYRASGAGLACLCSSDEIYAAQAAGAAEALREAGCARIYLAGRPGEIEAQLREAGVTGFVHVGCNLLALLEDALNA